MRHLLTCDCAFVPCVQGGWAACVVLRVPQSARQWPTSSMGRGGPVWGLGRQTNVGVWCVFVGFWSQTGTRPPPATRSNVLVRPKNIFGSNSRYSIVPQHHQCAIGTLSSFNRHHAVLLSSDLISGKIFKIQHTMAPYASARENAMLSPAFAG